MSGKYTPLPAYERSHRRFNIVHNIINRKCTPVRDQSAMRKVTVAKQRLGVTSILYFYKMRKCKRKQRCCFLSKLVTIRFSLPFVFIVLPMSPPFPLPQTSPSFYPPFPFSPLFFQLSSTSRQIANDGDSGLFSEIRRHHFRSNPR